jgi:DNA-binding MarR family transcriptional regulator
MPLRRNEEELAERWHDLMSDYHRTTCALDRALLAGHRITVSEFEVLQQLERTKGADGCVKMQVLADHVHLTQSALSRLVGRLEKESLVERSICEDDRRSIWVRITDEGLQRFAQARPTQRAVLREQRLPPARTTP